MNVNVCICVYVYDLVIFDLSGSPICLVVVNSFDSCFNAIFYFLFSFCWVIQLLSFILVSSFVVLLYIHTS